MNQTPRTLSLASQVSDGPDTYRFRTADGLHSVDAFRDAELLLLEVLWENAPGDLLVMQANYGVVGVVLAAKATSVTMTETSARAARVARANVSRNSVTATVSLARSPREIDTQFDTICYAPEPYLPVEIGKQWLVDALSRLRAGGRLYVAGEKSTGITRYEGCLEEHGQSVETVRREGTCRVLEATRPVDDDRPQYVSRRTVTAHVDGASLEMVTEPGLFSPNALDDGTRLLLETASVEDGETVLDLCCGYGPVGAYAAASADIDVLLTDDNVRATACAEETLDATGIDGTVVTADCLRGVDRSVDRVLCNPPTHAGSGVLSELFSGVDDVLEDGGALTVVHHRTLDLDEYLEKVGRIAERRHSQDHTVVTVRPVK